MYYNYRLDANVQSVMVDPTRGLGSTAGPGSIWCQSLNKWRGTAKPDYLLTAVDVRLERVNTQQALHPISTHNYNVLLLRDER